MTAARPDRYARQSLFQGIGAEGQAALERSKVVVIGLGALGAASADILARAGVGSLKLIDRDVLELSNLQRQVLYSEDDLAAGLPKAEAARRRLSRVNSSIAIEAVVADVVPETIREHAEDADLIVDGTDNFETRLLINDLALERSIPWVYCGVIGASVHSLPVLPGDGPCFRCYLAEAPPPGVVETCDTAGVIGPAVLVAVGIATGEALKILCGRRERVARGLQIMELWDRSFRLLKVKPDPACPACAGRFDYLAGKASAAVSLCGRGAIQLQPRERSELDLDAIASRLAPSGEASGNRFLLRFRPADWPEGELTLFRDGRVIVKGAEDPGRARALSARYFGA